MSIKKRLKLESLEERRLLTHVGWDFGDGPAVLTYTVGDVPQEGLTIYEDNNGTSRELTNGEFRQLVDFAFDVWAQAADIEFDSLPAGAVGADNSIDIAFGDVVNDQHSGYTLFPPRHPHTRETTCQHLELLDLFDVSDSPCNSGNLEQYLTRFAGDIRIDTHNVVDGQIVERRWEIGNEDDAKEDHVTDAYDLKFVIVHEIGHALGLDHFPSVIGKTWVMNGHVGKESQFQGLTFADRAAIQYLYPLDNVSLVLDQVTAQIDADNDEFDFNLDSVLDGEDREAFITEFLQPIVGDSNLDGVFDSSDFITVFIVNKFQTGEDATWEDGDWNGDGKFDTADFVAAFVAGFYEGTFPVGVLPV